MHSNSASFRAEGSLLSPDFHAFVQDLRESASIPGISVGAVRLSGDNQEPHVETASWGRKSEAGDGHDLAPDSLFGLASCSKAFLATSLGLLIDDFAHGHNVTPLPAGVSRLDWDTKVAAILPEEWRLNDVWATRAASIRDVLGHVSGLGRHDLTYIAGDSAEDVVRRMRHLRMAYELREKHSYNNQMYILGSRIIERYANMSYPEYVVERLFKPLKMDATTFSPSEARNSGKLTHSWTPQGRRIPFWFTDEVARLLAGPGGVISSAEDMVKWLAVWLNKGVDPVSGATIFPRSVYEAVTTAQSVVSGSPTEDYGAGIVGYGMGWRRWTYDGVEVVSHTGGIPGFSTHTAFSPRSNLGVVVLINADEQGKHALAILKRAFDDVLNRTSGSLVVHPKVATEKVAHTLDNVTSKPPSLDLAAAYTGTYVSSGYGSVTLCSPTNASSASTGVLAAFSALDGPATDPAPLELYGAYPSVLSTHVRLRHLSRDTFSVAFTALFPHGYGRDTSAFEWLEPGLSEGRAVFVVRGGEVEGFALLIDEEAVEARRRRTGGTEREVADAWFARV